MIPSKNGGPFAFHSQLGWCVEKLRKEGCNLMQRIVTQDFVLGNFAHHHLEVSSQIKDFSTIQMLMTMYNTEFCEIKGLERIGIETTHIKKISGADRRFLQMIDKNSRKVESQYELSLPLKDTQVTFFNNRFLPRRDFSIFKEDL